MTPAIIARISRNITTVVCTVAVLLTASCVGQKEASEEKRSEDHSDSHHAEWSYEANNGPAHWGEMDPEWVLCAEGLKQSPIDLVNATEIELPATVMHLPSEQEVDVLSQKGVIGALDNGHTIQINSKTGEYMTVGGHTYMLVQFHFHAPSEHTVNARHFPMEMHFVHQSEEGELAVVGVLIEAGAHNPGVETLWEQLAEVPGSRTTVRMPADFADFVFPSDAIGVYHYDGSLTTPPCSEGVKWYIRTNPIQLSEAQIAAFTAVYDHNNRPMQALNDRTLYRDDSPALTIR